MVGERRVRSRRLRPLPRRGQDQRHPADRHHLHRHRPRPCHHLHVSHLIGGHPRQRERAVAGRSPPRPPRPVTPRLRRCPQALRRAAVPGKWRFPGPPTPSPTWRATTCTATGSRSTPPRSPPPPSPTPAGPLPPPTPTGSRPSTRTATRALSPLPSPPRPPGATRLELRRDLRVRHGRGQPRSRPGPSPVLPSAPSTTARAPRQARCPAGSRDRRRPPTRACTRPRPPA